MILLLLIVMTECIRQDRVYSARCRDRVYSAMLHFQIILLFFCLLFWNCDHATSEVRFFLVFFDRVYSAVAETEGIRRQPSVFGQLRVYSAGSECIRRSNTLQSVTEGIRQNVTSVFGDRVYSATCECIRQKCFESLQ